MSNTGMGMLMSLLLCIVLVQLVSLPSLASPALGPAFVWSNRQKRFETGDHVARHRIHYQTLAPDDLVEVVKEEFSWTDDWRWEENLRRSADVVVAFFGNKLLSEDVSGLDGTTTTSDLVQVLGAAVMSSNSSVSLPYVVPPRDGRSLSEALLRSFVNSDLDEDGIRVGEVITMGSCVNTNQSAFKNLTNMDGLKDFLSKRKEIKEKEETVLLVVCSNSAGYKSIQGADPLSEAQMLDELLCGLDESKSHYVAFYATDISERKLTINRRPKWRQLGSDRYQEEEFCNEVCRTKASLLEGLFVAATLLVILISGICCMSGITSSTRFEQSKDGQ